MRVYIWGGGGLVIGILRYIHKWPPCNFEKLKMSGAKERSE